MGRVSRVLLSLAFVSSLALAGCRADVSGLQLATPAEVAAWQAGGDVTVCDANNNDTRTEYGVVPGATRLSDYAAYDVTRELPSGRDHRLVFYCHSEMCGAAADAARKAIAAGYGDVWVMDEGIRGWVSAGLPVEAVESEEAPS